MEYLRTPDHAGQTDKSTAPAGSPDRAGIKSSFQQLFTPALGVHGTFLTPVPTGSGLTPFLGGPGTTTPGLVTPGIGMMSGFTPAPKGGAPNASPDMMLNSPYLQAAAKEAVRREFMNMPSYIAGVGAVPLAAASPQQRQLVYTKDGNPVPQSETGTTTQAERDEAADAEVPSGSPQTSTKDKNSDETSSPPAKVPESKPSNPPASSAPATSAAAPHPPFANRQAPFYAPAPGGMFIMPPHMVPGAMAGGAAGPMYMHAPMMYAQPGAHGMMMMAAPHAQLAHAAVAARGPPKPETADERKARIEQEKQDLIREFKKKTREAALVRFRQKRRERRFGKLIRYECRKQLADARPRVKGRFVRIRPTDNNEDAQVVPQ